MSSNPDPRDLGVDPAVARHAVLHGFTRREAIARDTMLGDLQRESFGYFVHEVNEANGLVLDKTARRVTRAGNSVELTTREFDLLTALMERAGQAQARQELLDRVWGAEWIGDPRTAYA